MLLLMKSTNFCYVHLNSYFLQKCMEMQEITNFERLSKYVAFDEMYEF